MAISRILHNWLSHLKAVPLVPLLLILGLVLVDLVFVNIKRVKPAEEPDYSLYEQTLLDDNAQKLEGSAFVNNASPLGELQVSGSLEDFAGFVLVEKGSLLNDAKTTSNIEELRNGLLSYGVEEGDNLSSIAAQFGISVNTVIWANDISDSSLIQPGEELVILPVSGILHVVAEGETLPSIADAYDVELSEIATFNENKIAVGDTVVVPHAKPASEKVAAYSGSSLPDLSGYFVAPVANGWNWGELHDANAVDVAAACGTPIVAAADGLVVSVGSPSNWNSGYGGFIRLEHANGTETFYAHNKANLVSVGDRVSQGEQIADLGNTGRVYGVTGCHVHFGVAGAQNPLAR